MSVAWNNPLCLGQGAYDAPTEVDYPLGQAEAAGNSTGR